MDHKIMRLASLLFLSAFALFGQIQPLGVYEFPRIGFQSASSSFTLDTAAKWVSYKFYADGSALNEVRLRFGTVTGTVAAGECELTLRQADQALAVDGPDLATALETKTNGSALSSSTYVDFTGWTTTLTAGKRYWVVVKNLNATPASNNFILSYVGNATYASDTIFRASTTSNSGSTWTVLNNLPNIRLKLSSGQYVGGIMFAGTTPAGGASEAVYSNRESGVAFTVPASLPFRPRVRGVRLALNNTGTPATNVTVIVRQDGTAVTGGTGAEGFSETVAVAANTLEYLFATPITLVPGLKYRVAITTTGGDVSNYYMISRYITWDSDSNSLSMVPWGWQKTYCTGTCGTPANWTDTNTSIPEMWLILAGDTPAYSRETTSGGVN